MTEAEYTRAVHKLLPACIYHWKINDRFTKGIPDAYYSSSKGDLWIEYKYQKRFPKRAPIKPNLSPLQYEWLIARHTENRQVAVVVASPKGAIIITSPEQWTDGAPHPKTLLSKKEVAAWIDATIGGSNDPDPQPQTESTS